MLVFPHLELALFTLPELLTSDLVVYMRLQENCPIQALESCVCLKSLEIELLNSDSSRPLVTALQTHLPNLDTINVYAIGPELTDQDRAAVVSTCRRGWRSIGVKDAGLFTVEAVMKHCSTLEALNLRMAPRLESFITLSEDDYGNNKWFNDEYTHFMAEDFIDATITAELSSDSFKPWTCESTLNVFCAKIFRDSKTRHHQYLLWTTI
ncbi:hypothetical protein BGZ47_004999 [Haplosporangium gracile]|nr:hypothetical protein BGZ47_004999 [Haplosporangium gracile]